MCNASAAAWESKPAFLQYIKKEGTAGRKVCDYINSNDIRVELAPVTPITEATGKASDHGRIMVCLSSAAKKRCCDM